MVDKKEIEDVFQGIMSRMEAEYQSMTEDELRKRWYFEYDPKTSLSWNIYQFCKSIESYRASCRRWEEMHHGSCCVVERVRDKYLMPKIKEFEQLMKEGSL